MFCIGQLSLRRRPQYSLYPLYYFSFITTQVPCHSGFELELASKLHKYLYIKRRRIAPRSLVFELIIKYLIAPVYFISSNQFILISFNFNRGTTMIKLQTFNDQLVLMRTLDKLGFTQLTAAVLEFLFRYFFSLQIKATSVKRLSFNQ